MLRFRAGGLLNMSGDFLPDNNQVGIDNWSEIRWWSDNYYFLSGGELQSPVSTLPLPHPR